MDFNELQTRVRQSSNIVFFGGAGVSTESDIPDFRSAKGLFQKGESPISPEEILSRSFFERNPEMFFEFYRQNLIYPDAKPNDAHKTLARLEEKQQLKAVITQNIDGLHQMAGSRKVIELHGSVERNYCMQCGKAYSLKDVLASDEIVPRCDSCGGIVRPDVVLYEEQLDNEVMESAIHAISQAEILIVGGTSLTVYPAAGLIRYYTGDCLLLINESPTSYDAVANYVIADRIGKVMSRFIS